MKENPYESECMLSEYLLFHYGTAADCLGEFPGPREAAGFAERVVSELLDVELLQEWKTKNPDVAAAALDVGCAVGASSFALSRYCDRVLGVDYSASFIHAAQTLKVHGELQTQVTVEGKRTAPFVAKVPATARREVVTFEVADATALADALGGFAVVLAANLICRLPSPRKFLDRLPQLVAPGGQLLLATPFTWLEEFTPSSEWLGAREEGPESFDVLREILSPRFELIARCEIPMLLRETRRKFQYTVSCGSRWVRKAE